jgi:signal transduction histidine kinase
MRSLEELGNMATSLWRRVLGTDTQRRFQEKGLRRVAFRLATQTVGLLLVMLIVLEIVVYVITRQTLVGSLETTLKARANQSDPHACELLRLPCERSGTGRGGGPPPGGGGGGGSIVPPSDATAAYVNRGLRVVHADGVLGAVLLDKQTLARAISTGQDQCCSVHSYEGQDYLVYSKPLRGQSGVAGAVQTSISEHQYEGTIGSLLQALILVALLGLIISGGISVVLVRRALQPIRTAIQRQRDFVADAAHELRTPLAIQRTVGEVGMGDLSVDDLRSSMAQMLGENQHLTRLVEDLSLLARSDTDTVVLERTAIDLNSLIQETVAELVPLAQEQGVALAAELKDDVWTVGDLLRLRQLLLILIDNALKHTPSGGAVQVRLTAQGERVRLQVTDSGPGITPRDLPRIFDRFYRSDTARVGEGTGLGLAIGKWIVEAHGGQIQASNGESSGAVFTATLPTGSGRVQSS